MIFISAVAADFLGLVTSAGLVEAAIHQNVREKPRAVLTEPGNAK